MDRIKTFFRTSDWESVGVAAFYGYFAINILMKALAYDHGDNIYKFFFIFAMSFWAIKIVTTRYTLREIAWIAVLLALRDYEAKYVAAAFHDDHCHEELQVRADDSDGGVHPGLLSGYAGDRVNVRGL